MYDKFNERLLNKKAYLGRWREHIDRRIHRKHRAQFPDLDQLTDQGLPPETGKALVPDGG